MSQVNTVAHHAPHFPTNPEKFEFDGSVAAVFDSMALRSIPNYAEVHRLHAEMFSDRFTAGAVVCDIGSSTGALFHAIQTEIGASIGRVGITGYAIDCSQPMMDTLKDRYPDVRPIVGDIATLPDLPVPATFMACLYVLQFMRGRQRSDALDWIKRNLAPGGVLILAQKELEPYRHAATFSRTYYNLRRRNGYTQEEIDKKTSALKNSMWTVPPEELTWELQSRNLAYTETTRWVQFTSGVVTHRS
jgi:tRNA (cmo5U34)-methyltransferase